MVIPVERDTCRDLPAACDPPVHLNNSLRMEALLQSFPTLRAADGVAPWNPARFQRWVRSSAPGHGAHCAGRFVLSVWNPSTRWKCGRFEPHEALGVWDPEHRAAFVAWARAPWWP